MDMLNALIRSHQWTPWQLFVVWFVGLCLFIAAWNRADVYIDRQQYTCRIKPEDTE